MKISLTDQKSLLVVVDMINGFINQGALADPSINLITPNITKLVDIYTKHQQPVLAFIDAHSEDAIEFQSFPTHCLKSSYESELIEELLPYKALMTIIEKNSTNGFFAVDFDEYLASLGSLNQIIITGCCTDICVLQFTLTLKTYFNQNDLKCELIVPKNCVDTFGNEFHDKEHYNLVALDLMRGAGVTVVDSVEVIYE